MTSNHSKGGESSQILDSSANQHQCELMSSPDETGTEIIRVSSNQGLSFQFESLGLKVVSGPDEGLHKTLSLPIVRIGTAADNDIILTDRAVSRHHAEIHMTSEGLLLKDLGSTNGSFIGQLRITEAYMNPESECVLGYSRIAIQQRTERRRVSVSRQNNLGELVGHSKRMRELFGLIRAVASTPTTVLINGESGCGKELVAKTLHELSGRRGPLVVFDASVADPEMVRNDLFGHIKGAFTGASGQRDGAFRRAHGGTLFIDEIGELPLDLQPRLLRALESREVSPVGSDQPVRVDVRVVAATHRNLEAMVQDGQFRADLFYRLSVVPIRVPALREIPEDIPLLVESFVKRLELNVRIAPDAMDALQRYRWPGNVRELRNVLERAAALKQGEEIREEDLRLPSAEHKPVPHPAATPSSPTTPPPSFPTREVDDEESGDPPTLPASASRSQLRDLERQMIMETLRRNGNNKSAAARELQMPLSTLKRRLKDYKMS